MTDNIYYNFSGFYLNLLLCIYCLHFNNNIIYLLLNKIYLFNAMSFIIIVNMIGLYLILNKLNFEINITWTIKYKND